MVLVRAAGVFGVVIRPPDAQLSSHWRELGHAAVPRLFAGTQSTHGQGGMAPTLPPGASPGTRIF